MVTEDRDGLTFTKGFADYKLLMVVTFNFQSRQVRVSTQDGVYEPWYTFEAQALRLGRAVMVGHILQDLAHLQLPVTWPLREPSTILEQWDLARNLLETWGCSMG